MEIATIIFENGWYGVHDHKTNTKIMCSNCVFAMDLASDIVASFQEELWKEKEKVQHEKENHTKEGIQGHEDHKTVL